jgi:uncharacterized protein YlaN (UPF0358 family)
MKNHNYHTAIYTIQPGEKNHATFYLINTTPNRNKWAVTDKALQEALPTILNKTIGCGPEYRNDKHYPEPVKLGTFTEYKKPNGYALATAQISDQTAWNKLTNGEWGPISVVINSYLETCSKCQQDLTSTENPFNHECIAEGKAHLQVESFVFERVDFIDNPAYPQAGYLHTAATSNKVSLELLAQFYEGKPPANGSPIQPNPISNQRKKPMTQENLQERITQLEQQLSDEKKIRENLQTQLNNIQTRRHNELVDETLQARSQANLVNDPTEERKRLTEYSEDFLIQLKKDAKKIAETITQQMGAPKTKNDGPNPTEIQAAIETTRTKLFGTRRDS